MSALRSRTLPNLSSSLNCLGEIGGIQSVETHPIEIFWKRRTRIVALFLSYSSTVFQYLHPTRQSSVVSVEFVVDSILIEYFSPYSFDRDGGSQLLDEVVDAKSRPAI